MGGAKTAFPEKDGASSNVTFPYKNDQCVPGYFCPNGTDIPTPCSAGYFSSQKGLKAASDCKECPPGRYCDTIGLQSIADPPKCSAGFVCRAACSTPTPRDGIKGYPCPRGKYCQEGMKIHLLISNCDSYSHITTSHVDSTYMHIFIAIRV